MLVRKPAKTAHLTNQDSTDTPPQTNTITSWLWNWPEGLFYMSKIIITYVWCSVSRCTAPKTDRRQLASELRWSHFFIEKRWSHWLIIVSVTVSVPLVDPWRTQRGRRVDSWYSLPLLSDRQPPLFSHQSNSTNTPNSIGRRSRDRSRTRPIIR
jgi:hypothetical protein